MFVVCCALSAGCRLLVVGSGLVRVVRCLLCDVCC